MVEGKVFPIYQVHLNLSQETANVEAITRSLKEEFGVKVVSAGQPVFTNHAKRLNSRYVI